MSRLFMCSLGVPVLLVAYSPVEAQDSTTVPTCAAETQTARFEATVARFSAEGSDKVDLTSSDLAQEHVHPTSTGNWQFMDSGILYAEFNHQGGARGADEFVAPNWWMGMAVRNTSRGRFTFASMLSLDPALVGKNGYA